METKSGAKTFKNEVKAQWTIKKSSDLRQIVLTSQRKTPDYFHVPTLFPEKLTKVWKDVRSRNIKEREKKVPGSVPLRQKVNGLQSHLRPVVHPSVVEMCVFRLFCCTQLANKPISDALNAQKHPGAEDVTLKLHLTNQIPSVNNQLSWELPTLWHWNAAL